MSEEFISSPQAFRDFLESTIWQDLKAELERMREAVRDELESADGVELYRFQGRSEVLRDIILLPSIIADTLDDSNVPISFDGDSFDEDSFDEDLETL